MVRTMAALVVAIAAGGCWTSGGETTPVTTTPPPLPTAKTDKDARPQPVAQHDDGAGCDEVSCVLDNYERACCLRFRKRLPSAPTGSPPVTSLDRAMIVTGVTNVKPQIVACGQQLPNVHGTVKVQVQVDPSGAVTSVTIAATPDAALGACVAGEMQRARFDATTTGGSFAYPFVF